MKDALLPTVAVKPRSYQPPKADLEADASIDVDPDELALPVL